MTGSATGPVAVIAGQGRLAPRIVAALDAPRVFALEGFTPEGLAAEPFRLERLAPLLDRLVDEGVERVIFAGAVRRPRLDPEMFDPRTAALLPRILGAMQSGDDGALREVIAIFEDWGLSVVGVSDILPDLVPGEGVLAGEPTPADRRDAERGAEILAALGALDIGQGTVVAQGLCLAVETLPGTEAMLDFVALHPGLRPDPKGARGVFYKAPKPGQDLRIDLPTLGPDSVAQAARAGLAGIAWQAGGVILLEREATVAAANDAGLFLWARA
ncbi:UDP-2,3-diacylglucosamine diphosphatase LpxI [Paracoccus sp. Z118]|uniref:LpxI family protein n=1 Tax=Paracoccus sp. Z118 TaxID=2851017 RepID=UPI001C2C5C06|nr:UDP-2,3-diacylglucosamine diphosphatase LpxI [Paracoccus sp. Z118]MBV0890492.1 UDP-2,3-diacylglucosamine diphosphatase LpxI [Paracoccus sp. Z118]